MNRIFSFILFASLTFFVESVFAQGRVNFIYEKDTVSLKEGHIKLEWEGAEGPYELQSANSRDFDPADVEYRGPDRASFISGLENGTYFYRVRAKDGLWSDVLLLEVKHQSLQLAFTLFGLGAIVFFLTVWVVVSGARKVQSEQEIKS